MLIKEVKVNKLLLVSGESELSTLLASFLGRKNQICQGQGECRQHELKLSSEAPLLMLMS